jgi:hypothetical protein
VLAFAAVARHAHGLALRARAPRAKRERD